MRTIEERFTEFWQWLVALPPDFAFLLSIPFLVGLTGLLAELGRRRKQDRHRG
jgi:hypothetical protein